MYPASNAKASSWSKIKEAKKVCDFSWVPNIYYTHCIGSAVCRDTLSGTHKPQITFTQEIRFHLKSYQKKLLYESLSKLKR